MAAYVFAKFLVIVNVLLVPLASVAGVIEDGTIGAQYIFGNLGFFNSIFPVTETIVLTSLALTIKTAIFGFKVVIALFNMSKYAFRNIVSWRF